MKYLFVKNITNNIGESGVDLLLNRRDDVLQKVEPLVFETNLLHLDVDCGNVLISARESRIEVLIATRRPGAKSFHDRDHVIAELVAYKREPVHICAWLEFDLFVFSESKKLNYLELFFLY